MIGEWIDRRSKKQIAAIIIGIIALLLALPFIFSGTLP